MQKVIFLISYLPIKLYGKYAKPKDSLTFLFSLHKRMLTLISDRASDYEGGVHPKHRLMQYHKFFTDRIKPKERVLDIGSGRAYLAYQMAQAGAVVTGIELSARNIEISQKLYKHEGLTFIHGDAWKDLPHEKFDTVVMSNVLEHIDERVKFIRMVEQWVSASRWLIRVPCFDRDWTVALAKELGLDSRLDETHFTEFTDESFRREMHEAGMDITHFEKQWGEIWAEVKPSKS